MVIESSIRIIEPNSKWPLPEESTAFGTSSSSMAIEKLRIRLKGQRFQATRKDMVPNRSESAPPSIEGSLAAFESFICQQNLTSNSSLTSLKNVADNWEKHLLVHDIGGNFSIHEEESEEDRSPKWASADWMDRRNRKISGHQIASTGQSRTLVDSREENFLNTPTPFYNQSHCSGHKSIETAGHYDAHTSSLNDCSVRTLNPIESSPSADDMGQISCSDSSVAPLPKSSSLDSKTGTAAKPSLYRGNLNCVAGHQENDMLTSRVTCSDACIESGMEAMEITILPQIENKKNRKDRQNKIMIQQHVFKQQSTTSQSQGVQSSLNSQGITYPYLGTEQIFHGSSDLSVTEVQPMLQSSGFIPPLYAAAAAYNSPNLFYPSLQPSGYFHPQYGLGGYNTSPTSLPQFASGYPFFNTVPMAFDGPVGPNLTARTPGVPTGGSAEHRVDMQHSKLHGQLGYPMQPSLPDPLNMQYFQQSFLDTYDVSGHFDYWAPRDGVYKGHINSFDSGKGTEHSVCSIEWTLQQGSGGHLNSNPRRGGFTSSYYFGSPTNTGVLMQFPASPVASLVVPGSAEGGIAFSRGKNEVMLPLHSAGNVGIYSGCQRELENIDNAKVHSFLEELKSGKGRRFELVDIGGHIVEFSADQHGSRFIQKKLENCGSEEKASVFKEVLPHVSKLMTDVFGNYIIQKFFEYGSPEQRMELANQLEGQILPLSLQMYGCRVIQKALEVIELDQKIRLVYELDGHVLRCIQDQNGNHVIQKCIECIPADKIGFIISSFRGQVATLSTHPYGCRVIQRVIEHCMAELQSQFIVDEILESVCELARDQYGNYVMQHVLYRGKPRERNQIISKLSGHVVQLSQHKFASNVVEKSFEYGDPVTREILIGEIFGHGDRNDNLLTMMKDQYANYVVQKILQTCTDNAQREMLLNRVRNHINSLKKYTYGKHIVARFEQLYEEEFHPH